MEIEGFVARLKESDLYRGLPEMDESNPIFNKQELEASLTAALTGYYSVQRSSLTI